MKSALLLAAAAMSISAFSTSASAAEIVAENGFGTIGGLSSCKSGSNSTGFSSGTLLSAGNWSGGCAGFYQVDLDTNLQTLTLSTLQGGNYESGFLSITGISEVAISGLSIESLGGLFLDDGFYGVPTPVLSFTSDSILIEFSRIGQSPGQFRFNDTVGQQAVFSYQTAGMAAVPEPATWAFMLLGFFAIGAMIRRRPSVNSVSVSYS